MSTGKTGRIGRKLSLSVKILVSLIAALVLGLGVTTDGDILGLSPGNSDNPDDWSHR